MMAMVMGSDGDGNRDGDGDGYSDGDGDSGGDGDMLLKAFCAWLAIIMNNRVINSGRVECVLAS